MPLSGGVKDHFVGWAATLVDGLDTLYVMGMKAEFEEALKALEQIDFSQPKSDNIPIFETTIRYLGGLLGAWDISGHQYPILLEKATQLGDMLCKAFETESGIPVPYLYWQRPVTGKLEGQDGVMVAQIGTLSLEFIRLSHVTGDTKYANAVQKITDQLEGTQNSTALPGMWPKVVDCSGPTLSFSSTEFTLGAPVDSAFEYLPKTHLLLHPSPSSQRYHSMYQTAFSTFSTNLFFRPLLPGDPDILFSGALNTASSPPWFDAQVTQLGCYVGGMVGLGSRINNSPEELETAKKLTNGCVWGYENTVTGIMPDSFHVGKCPDLAPCSWDGEGAGFKSVDDPSYILRPEAIESIFIMYRLTADESWQDKGWKMFEAIAKHTRTEIAHARLRNVMRLDSDKVDSMESFWLAETLKYFYLLFSEPGVSSLHELVDMMTLDLESNPERAG